MQQEQTGLSLREKLKVLSLLYEAERSERGGEVVMRSGENSARAFFVGGRIAWVTVSSIKRTFTQYLREKTGLEPEETEGVFDECRRTGANFGEIIVEWGLASEETLRRLLLEHLTECLVEVLSWEAAECMFVPEERSYRGRLTFTLEELLDCVLSAEGSDRLAFAGHGRDEILARLRSEREPTQPNIPSFALEDVRGRDEHAPARRDEPACPDGPEMIPAGQPNDLRGPRRATVHYRDGVSRRGLLQRVDPQAKKVRLEPSGAGSKKVEELGADGLMAIFILLPRGTAYPEKTGKAVRVVMSDGRKLEGFTADYDPASRAFTLFPREDRGNIERVIIYNDAVKNICFD